MSLEIGADSSATACGHPCTSLRLLFDAVDPVTGEPFGVARCPLCNLAQTVPAPPPASLGRYYPKGYHSSTKRYHGGLDSILSLLHRSRIHSLERLLGGPGSVLNVGCGPGVLLNQMRARGWRVRGTERSAGAAKPAQEVFQLDVRAQEVADLVAERATFNAVVLWHVAEHLPAPRETLAQIAQLLEPGGVLLVAVPNFGSPEARLGRANWFHLDVPRHLVHFTPKTLSKILLDAGFAAVKITHLVPEYDLFSFIQTVENRLGFSPNLLYDLLRRSEAHLRPAPAGRLESCLAVGLAVPLSLAAAVITPLLAALRQSATLVVYAIRADPQAN